MITKFQKTLTADVLALFTLALESELVIRAVNILLPGRLTTDMTIGAFIVLGAISIAIFHASEGKLSAMKWGWLTLGSPLVGFAFLSFDWLLAFVYGYSNPLHSPGSLLGLPLTILVCPVGTMVCVAGFARAVLMSRVQNV